MKVLDIATGTGLAAAECLRAVGPTGHVVAADLSEAMVEQARQRLGTASNVSVAVEDGQSISFADGSFDALICSLGLMFFLIRPAVYRNFCVYSVQADAQQPLSLRCPNGPTMVGSILS
jgi:ubiquinone/menaquinone biosynthesis C-methylase UbiE